MTVFDLFNFKNYIFNMFAYPPLISGLCIAVLGWSVAAREKFLGISLTFLLLTSCVSAWLLSYYLVYSSATAGLAIFWSKSANTAVVFIPSFYYFFALSASRSLSRKSVFAFLALAASEIFLISLWGSGHFLVGVKKYFWGYYPIYRTASYPFLIFFAILSLESFRLFWMCDKKYGKSTKRFKTFLIGFGIAYLAMVDFFAAYGIGIYPAGYLPILFFTGFMSWGIWRYRLVDITPSFAASQILKTMADALLVVDREGIIRVANESANQLLTESGRTELEGQKVNLDGIDFFQKQNLARLLWTGGVQNHLIIYTSKGSGQRMLDISTSVVRDSYRDPVAVIFILKDVTAKKNSETALKESEKRYRLLAENATDLIWTLNRKLQWTYMSPSVERFSGCPSEEALTYELEKTFAPSSVKPAMDAFTHMFHDSESGPRTMELEYLKKDGNSVWAEVLLSVIRDSNGGAAEILGVSRDITEHRRVRELLKHSDASYYELLLTLSDPIILLDRNGVIKYINHAVQQLLGTAATELSGQLFSKIGILPAEYAAKTLQEITCVLLGWQRLSFDSVLIRKDGARILAEMQPRLIGKEMENPLVEIVLKNIREVPGNVSEEKVA